MKPGLVMAKENKETASPRRTAAMSHLPEKRTPSKKAAKGEQKRFGRRNQTNRRQPQQTQSG